MKNEHSFTFQSNVVKLLVTDGEPPKKRQPDESDILVHVKNQEEEINEDVLEKLDQATDLIKKKFSKDPDSELDTYKLRISKYDVYIRDESKDNLILGTVLYILDHISDGVDKLIDEQGSNSESNTNNEEENSEEDSLLDKKEEEENTELEIHLPENEENSKNHKSRFDISSVNLKDEKEEDDDPSEMVNMLLNSRN